MTPLKLVSADWATVRATIIEQDGLIGLLSWKLKENHGWTFRLASAWRDDWVDIDFWNDTAKSMFLLKYSHLIEKSLKELNKATG